MRAGGAAGEAAWHGRHRLLPIQRSRGGHRSRRWAACIMTRCFLGRRRRGELIIGGRRRPEITAGQKAADWHRAARRTQNIIVARGRRAKPPLLANFASGRTRLGAPARISSRYRLRGGAHYLS